jgi:hypothetical protein
MKRRWGLEGNRAKRLPQNLLKTIKAVEEFQEENLPLRIGSE